MRGSEAVPLVMVYLTQLEGGKIKGAVFATTNLESHPVGWRREFYSVYPVCDRTDVHFGYSDKNYNIRDTECWILSTQIAARSWLAPKIQNDFYSWSADKGRPTVGLANIYYVVKGGDLVWAAYAYNPEMEGFARVEAASENSPWHRDFAVTDPKKVAYIARVKTEGERLFERIKAGFNGPLAASR
jgi:hypothetical protein